MSARPQRFRFGDCTFNQSTGELSTPSGRERLQPKPAQVLGLLLERAGQLVTREELQRSIWPDTSVEFDQGLNYCIRQIRAALGEDANGEGTIETLPRRGYRLRIEVQPVGGLATSKWLGWSAALLAIAAALAVWWLTGPPQAVPNAAVRVAVLALEDPSGDARSLDENGRLTEALVVGLTAAEDGAVAVLGPATTSVYQGGATSQTEIGRELAVAFIVSGGYRASDDTLFVQVIRVEDGEHVFARRLELGEASRDEAMRSIVDGIAETVRATG